MKRFMPLFGIAVVSVVLIQALPAGAQTNRSTYTAPSAPVAKKVTVGTAVYAIVEGNNQALNTGKKACASWKQNFLGYKNLSNTSVCKTAHPTAKVVANSVNGSKNGFWCNGKPQVGVCGTSLNTCMVCPTCNVNANGDTQIGDQYAEMYASCGGTLAASSSSRTRSSRSSSSSSVVAGKKCSFKQGTSAGNRVLTTCNVKGAPDNFCIAAFGGLFPSARAVACAQNGEVTCNVPCSAPGAQNLARCPFGATTTAPVGSCPSSRSSAASSTAGKVPLGGLCKHGGECQDTWGGNQYFVHCVGFSPNSRCSCSQTSQTEWGCVKNLNNLKNQAAGQPCVHGGNCASGMCLGRACK